MIMKGEKLTNQDFHPCFIYNSYCQACQEQALAACLKIHFYLFWKSSFVHDAQLSIDLAPVSDGSCPFLSSLESGQI